MGTTNLNVEAYRVDSVAPFSFQRGTVASRQVVSGRLGEYQLQGTVIPLEIEQLSFNSLTQMLAEFEGRFGFSSVEMFSRYTHGVLNLSEDTEEWLELFIMYLGTSEVRQFSCP